MSSTPRVSVVLPVFNAASYLRVAVESVLAQTLTDWELIVIDDGSQDASPAILAELAERDARVRVFRQDNAGISAALNHGLRWARGNFVARMDADDIMLPHRLQAQLDFLEAHPTLGFCASDMAMINEHGKVFEQYCPEPRSLASLSDMMVRSEPIVFTHPTVMFRASCLKLAGGYDPAFEPCEDMELFGRLILAGHPGVVMDQVLLKYRVHARSISGSRIARQVRQQELVRRRFYERLRPGSVPQPWSWRDELKVNAEACKRAARFARAQGQGVGAWLWLIKAACLEPSGLIRAFRRRLMGMAGA